MGTILSIQLIPIDLPPVTALQKEAFAVLSTKCNVCHSTQNPKRVFTLGNMNGFAKKINRQVFVWKRMPKGKARKLSAQESLQLKKWIRDQLERQ